MDVVDRRSSASASAGVTVWSVVEPTKGVVWRPWEWRVVAREDPTDEPTGRPEGSRRDRSKGENMSAIF